MEDNKKETKKKTPNRKKKVEEKQQEIVQEVVQPIQSQMTMEQMQEMMTNMMQMMNMMQQSQVQQVQSNVIEKKEEIEKVVKNEKKKWSKVDLYDIEDEKIIVESVSDNIVYKSAKSGIVYRWNKTGDSDILTVREIINMDNASKRFLRTPWLKVNDERVIEALGLKDLYDLLEKVSDIDLLTKMSTPELERLFERLPKEYKEDFRDSIISKIRNKELRDLNVIEVLSDVLDTDLKNA